MSDSLFNAGIKPWALRIRQGELTFTDTLKTCLSQIEADATLDAWEVFDAKSALDTASSMDALLASGTDLGIMMGLPLAVKDLIRVDGYPVTNGSNADTDALVGPEGSIIRKLKQAGMIILGKTKTVEFALGVTGVNTSRGTPWNPVDRNVHRLPGGSSSGSAVAVAANHAALALGTDTGGSVRIPASFTGIVGHKTSVRLWPLDGVFSLSNTLDSMGPLCHTVDDAGLMHTLITGESIPAPVPLNGLRLGIPQEHFFDDLDPSVATDFERAVNALVQAGAVRVPINFPEAAERATLFPKIVPPELLSTLGIEQFEKIRANMDPVTASRAASGLSVTAVEYQSALRRQQELIAIANTTFHEVDCWVSPTTPIVPMALTDLDDPAQNARALNASWNTQPGNLTEFCAMSLPMHQRDSSNAAINQGFSSPPSSLPTGFQIMLPHGQDARLIAISASVEKLLNR